MKSISLFFFKMTCHSTTIFWPYGVRNQKISNDEADEEEEGNIPQNEQQGDSS